MAAAGPAVPESSPSSVDLFVWVWVLPVRSRDRSGCGGVAVPFYFPSPWVGGGGRISSTDRFQRGPCGLSFCHLPGPSLFIGPMSLTACLSLAQVSLSLPLGFGGSGWFGVCMCASDHPSSRISLNCMSAPRVLASSDIWCMVMGPIVAASSAVCWIPMACLAWYRALG